MYKSSEAVIRAGAVKAAGAGLIPIPLVDQASINSVQVDMIRQLCVFHDVSYESRQLQALIISVSATALARYGARYAIKAIPGIGSLVGGLSMGVFAGATTYALGHAVDAHLKNGGQLSDLKPENLANSLSGYMDKGKKWVESWIPGRRITRVADTEVETLVGEQPQPVEHNDVNRLILKIQELSELHKSGALSDEEFALLKQRLINS